jgi:NitT/TauT family transport system substrate-binding protein
MGAAYLISGNKGNYNVTLATAPTDIVAMINNGELDIACLPTNLAATLYNKSGGEIKLLALNTKGVLYILENGDSIKSVADLKGKTIYATGQASNPEYVLNYILTENGLKPGEDVKIEWRESDELATLMASGEVDVAMLPVPAATTVTVKNADVRYALDLTQEWDALDNGSGIYMGCVVVRAKFLEEYPIAVENFLFEYENSVNGMIGYIPALASGSDLSTISRLLVNTGIVGNDAIGAAALPKAGLCFISGAEMKTVIEGYYQVLFDYNPDSIGGALPGEDFYADLGK